MYRAKSNGDENVFKCGEIEGEKTPYGYKVTEVFLVDNSGFGSDNEPALTASAFLTKVKAGRYYAITGRGQFQVHVTEYEKVTGSRKALYKELGILKSKLVRRNTRLTEYTDGRRTLRLHATDIITWKPDGTKILNSGGYKTRTTKERLNAYINLNSTTNFWIYQRHGTWYIQDGDKTLEFTDGMEL